MSKTTNYTDYLKKYLRDSKESAEYLNAALETGDFSLIVLALKDVAEAGLRVSSSLTLFV